VSRNFVFEGLLGNLYIWLCLGFFKKEILMCDGRVSTGAAVCFFWQNFITSRKFLRNKKPEH
jgi:hypothetical protein